MKTGTQKAVIRCTKRIRDPLNYLIMQSTDHDQVSTSIHTRDAAIVTWYVPLHNLQHCLHRRYEAEQFGTLTLPKGVAPPAPKPLTMTEDCAVGAAGRTGPSVTPKFIMTAPSKSSSRSAPSSSAPSSSSDPLENQLNNTVTDSGETIVPLGLVTLIIGNNIPAKQSWIEKKIDPAPHPTISVRILAMDRIHWQRTSWLAGSICASLCWGRIPQRIFSVNLDFKNPVRIAANAAPGAPPGVLDFDEQQGRYTTPYRVDVPGLGFHMAMEDTGKTLFDADVPVVEGFMDNESALHRLSLAREVNMLGLGGSVYRQTLWSSPCLPNVAKVVECDYGELFTRYFGCSPVGDPVAAWLVRDVGTTLIYQMEGEVEDENDPNSATTYGDRSLTERVQKKAMNRYNGFRDEIRGKTYSEMRGDEVPR